MSVFQVRSSHARRSFVVNDADGDDDKIAVFSTSPASSKCRKQVPQDDHSVISDSKYLCNENPHLRNTHHPSLIDVDLFVKESKTDRFGVLKNKERR